MKRLAAVACLAVMLAIPPATVTAEARELSRAPTAASGSFIPCVEADSGAISCEPDWWEALDACAMCISSLLALAAAVTALVAAHGGSGGLTTVAAIALMRVAGLSLGALAFAMIADCVRCVRYTCAIQIARQIFWWGVDSLRVGYVLLPHFLPY